MRLDPVELARVQHALVLWINLHICWFCEDPRGVRLCNVPVVLTHVEDQIGGNLTTRNLQSDKANSFARVDMGGDGRAVNDLNEGPRLRPIGHLIFKSKLDAA